MSDTVPPTYVYPGPKFPNMGEVEFGKVTVECRSSQLVESMTLYQKFNLKLEQINRMK